MFPLDDEATVLAHLFTALFPASYETTHLSPKAKEPGVRGGGEASGQDRFLQCHTGRCSIHPDPGSWAGPAVSAHAGYRGVVTEGFPCMHKGSLHRKEF